MPARLILNADDFGLTHGINRAIGELHSAGVLTSATLMANGAAFDDAVEVARTHPTLGVGCHIVLTDGTPVSPPGTIRSLLGPDGKSFHPSLAKFVQALLLGRINQDEVAREALAQIEKLQLAGIGITHLDTHKHTHLFPSIASTLLQVAERCGIRAIRNPFEPRWSLALNHSRRMRRLAVRLIGCLRPSFEAHAQIRNGRVLTTDGTVAISATGQLNATALGEILRALPSTGTYELCCHPGYNDGELDRVRTRLRSEREAERKALLSELPKILACSGAPALVHYRDVTEEQNSTAPAADVTS
jgi:hopanoid biosynthesis associated protein HpnK